jgi:hypothetical protein
MRNPSMLSPLSLSALGKGIGLLSSSGSQTEIPAWARGSRQALTRVLFERMVFCEGLRCHYLSIQR